MYNAFTRNKSEFHQKKIKWLQIYYPDYYSFNNDNANKLLDRAQKLASEWGINDINPIQYYLFSTYTDMLASLGISLIGAYLDDHQQYSHDPKWKENSYGEKNLGIKRSEINAYLRNYL